MLALGSLLDGEYVIDSLIGKGGMSSIYCAHSATDSQDDRRFAIKELPASARDAAGMLVSQGISGQIALMKRIDHPGIVPMVEAFRMGDNFYLVSEYVEGRSLQSVAYCEGPQPPSQVVEWGLQLCQILGYLHGLQPAIVYRDLKPSNVMLAADGTLRLVDLGIAREYKDCDECDKDTAAFGTQGYAPPEQYGQAQTDARADIYALGCTLWHLLTGQVPPMEFPLPAVTSVEPSVPAGLAAVISRCTALSREDRYQSCEEVAAALQGCLGVVKRPLLQRLKRAVCAAQAELRGGEGVPSVEQPVVSRPAAPDLSTATLVVEKRTPALSEGFSFVVVQSDVCVHAAVTLDAGLSVTFS